MRLNVLCIVLSSLFIGHLASAQSPEDRIMSAEMDYQLGRFEACRDSARRIIFQEKDAIYRWQALRLKALSELSLNLIDTSRRSTIQML